MIQTVEQSTKCVHCSKTTLSTQRSFCLEVYRKADFRQTLSSEISPTTIDYRCECGGNEAVQSRKFNSDLSIMILRLWSFSTDGSINTKPMRIEPKVVKIPTSDGTKSYALKSAIVHHGGTLHQGHYTALCKFTKIPKINDCIKIEISS